MSETILLDPAEVSGTRVERDLTPYVGPEGPDFGDARIEAIVAQQQAGSIPVDFTVPDRVIAIPLVLTDQVSGVSFDEARSRIQAWVGLVQAEGGWIAREWSDGRKLFADITEASLKLGASSMAAWGFADADAVLTLTAVPDWYGAEVTLDTLSATGTGELVAVLEDGGVTANIEGDFPLGNRCSMEVTGGTVADQLGLVGAFRSRHYSADATAALSYEAEDLTPLDSASAVALTGASGGTAVLHDNLGSDWTPVLGTTIAATGAEMTHTGQYKLVARVYTMSLTPPDVRAVWDVGDLVSPSENPPVTIPGASNFYLLDLGTIRLDRVLVGDHRWQGQIQARGASGGENVYIDRIRLEPVPEWWARLTAPINVSPGLAGYSARDEFNQSAGALTGKTLPTGGTWAGAGDASDFSVETSGKTAQRAATSDADSFTGRYAIGGPVLADQVVRADYKVSLQVLSLQAVVARYVDINNWLMFTVTDGVDPACTVTKRVGGTVTTLAQGFGRPPGQDIWNTLRLMVDSAGRWFVWQSLRGSPLGKPSASGQDPVLATGGALATGKPAIYDVNTGVTASTRSFDNFAAWVPDVDAVLFAGQSAELRTDALLREDSAGAGYGLVTNPIGRLPRMPQSGSESRRVELMLASSRGDMDELPDSSPDDISVTPKYRACWLTVPGG